MREKSNEPLASAQSRAAVYRRVSSIIQEDRGYSLDGQLTECTELAERLGMVVVMERSDVGSGADWTCRASSTSSKPHRRANSIV